MPVSHEHMRNTVQTWNGRAYAMMATEEAKKLEKEGLIQITTHLTAAQLKYPHEFVTPSTDTDKSSTDAGKKKKKKRTYNTRQMKADT